MEKQTDMSLNREAVDLDISFFGYAPTFDYQNADAAYP